MIALISLLVIVTISLIVVRIGAVALTMTGMSRDLALFQAQSAFSGVGFTTRESESVMDHPARRNVIRMLMLLGNAGLGSAIATLVITLYGGTGADTALRLGWIAVGLGVLWLLSRSRFVDRILNRVFRAALARWTSLEVADYARLLELGQGYAVSRIEVRDGEWLCDRTLADSRVNDEGVLVLGMRRTNGKYVGTPRGETTVHGGDMLTCYGREAVLRKLAGRSSGATGDAEHAAAMREQQALEQSEHRAESP